MKEGETIVDGGDVEAEATAEEGIATIDRIRSLEGRAGAGMPTHFSHNKELNGGSNLDFNLLPVINFVVRQNKTETSTWGI